MMRVEVLMFIVLFSACSLDRGALAGVDSALESDASMYGQSGAGQVAVPIETNTGGVAGMVEANAGAGTGGSAGTMPENTPLAGAGWPFWPVTGQTGGTGGTDDGDADSGYDAGISDSGTGMQYSDAAIPDSSDASVQQDAAIEPECELPDDPEDDCHTWECDGDTAVQFIDDSDTPEWNRDHPLWDTLSTTMPTCNYYGCKDGSLGMQTRPECYIDREVTWGWGVCFYCFNGNTAYLFDCQDPNASSAWDAVCP